MYIVSLTPFHATQTGLNLPGSNANNDVLINGAIVYHAVATSIELSSIQVVVWRAAWAFSLVLVLAVASICDLAQTTLTLSLVSPHVLTCTIPVLPSIAMTSLLMHCPHTMTSLRHDLIVIHVLHLLLLLCYAVHLLRHALHVPIDR